MAYCKRCGAYIPDGQNKCLACGYNEAAERTAAEQKTKYSGSFASEYKEEKAKIEAERRKLEQERREVERQRRKQQEENKRWAEEEYEKRQRQREQTGEYSHVYRQNRTYSNSIGTHKGLAIASYFSIFFILPFILCPDDDFAKYHARQGLALFIFSLISDAVSSFIPFGWILSVFRVYCMFKGVGNAGSGKTEPLPYIGKYVEK